MSYEQWLALLHPDDRRSASEAVSHIIQQRQDYYKDEYRVEYKRSLQLTQIYQRDRNTISKEDAIQNIYKEISASCTTLSSGEEIALTYNKYPYDYLLQHLPGVTHALLWFKGCVSIKTAKAYLRSLGKTCCLYENPLILAFVSARRIDNSGDRSVTG